MIMYCVLQKGKDLNIFTIRNDSWEARYVYPDINVAQFGHIEIPHAPPESVVLYIHYKVKFK